MPKVRDLVDCPLCFGRLLPLSVCQSCNSVAVHDGMDEVGPQIACEDCAATNPTHFVCSACSARFPYGEIVKPEGPTCPVCHHPVPPGAELCPNCSAVLPFAGAGGVRPKRRIRGEYSVEDVREMSRIPGVGRVRAEALCAAGYNALWKIARATEEDLARVKGIGPKTSAEIKEALRFLLLIGRRKSKEEVLSEEYDCPLCGTVTSLFATACRGCGATFDEEELDEEFRTEVGREEDKALLAYYDVRLLEKPDSVALLLARALLLQAMGRGPDALASLDRVLEIEPNNSRALHAKTRALAGAKGIGSAAQVLREVVSAVAPRRPEPSPAAPETQEEAFRALEGLQEVECPECGEKQVGGAKVCPVCGHRFAPEEPAAPSAPGQVLEERLLEDLERAVAGEAKAPPPPLRPEVPEDVVGKKRSMLTFLLGVPGVGRRAAEAVSGFFQDMEQIRLSEIADLADIPGVAPAEARLIKEAVEGQFGPAPEEAPERPPPEATTPPPRPARAPPTRGQEVPPKPMPAPTPRPAAPRPVPAAPRARTAEITAGRRGLINGRGLVNGRGRVNGLINGSGFVNGSSVAEPRLPKKNLRARYFAIGASLIMLFTAVALLNVTSAAPGIQIDGSFSDWQGVPSYRIQTVSANKNVAFESESLAYDASSLFLRVAVNGTAFADTGAPDTLYTFLDTDGDNGTGYDVSGVGADYLVQVSGWGGAVQETRLSRFTPSNQKDQDHDNWTAWQTVGPVPAAVGKGEGSRSNVEVAVSQEELGSSKSVDPKAVRATFALDDNQDHTTHTDVPISAWDVVGRPSGQPGSLRVTQESVATTVGAGAAPFLRLTFAAFGGDVIIQDVTTRGTPGAILGPPPSYPFTVKPGDPKESVWTIDASGLPQGSVVFANVTRVDANAPYVVEGPPARAYVGSVAPGKRIDGLFSDWENAISYSNVSYIRRPSLNITRQDGSVLGSTVYLYVRLDGTPLEGSVVPQRLKRALQAPEGGGGGGGGGAGRSPPRVVGNDYVRFYIRTDDRSPGGFDLYNFRVDRYVELVGRGGRVTNGSAYYWTGSDWRWEGAVSWGMGARDVEVSAAMSGTTFNATRVVAVTMDWSGIADIAAPLATRAGTRGANGPVVLDVSGQFWLRDTTPSDPTGCNINRQATQTQGSGPVEHAVLAAGESACWDLDATSGNTIPAGDWQSVLDTSSSSPSDTTYNVTFQIWDKSTHAVFATVGSCTGVTTFGNDVTCTLYSVGSQTIAPNRVVRLRIENAGGSGGSVTIDYDNNNDAGDSSVFLAIPEFHDAAVPAILAVIAAIGIIGVRRRRRAGCAAAARTR